MSDKEIIPCPDCGEPQAGPAGAIGYWCENDDCPGEAQQFFRRMREAVVARSVELDNELEPHMRIDHDKLVDERLADPEYARAYVAELRALFREERENLFARDDQQKKLIERFKGALRPFAKLSLTSEPEFQRTRRINLEDYDASIRRARELLDGAE